MTGPIDPMPTQGRPIPHRNSAPPARKRDSEGNDQPRSHWRVLIVVGVFCATVVIVGWLIIR